MLSPAQIETADEALAPHLAAVDAEDARDRIARAMTKLEADAPPHSRETAHRLAQNVGRDAAALRQSVLHLAHACADLDAAGVGVGSATWARDLPQIVSFLSGDDDLRMIDESVLPDHEGLRRQIAIARVAVEHANSGRKALASEVTGELFDHIARSWPSGLTLLATIRALGEQSQAVRSHLLAVLGIIRAHGRGGEAFGWKESTLGAIEALLTAPPREQPAPSIPAPTKRKKRTTKANRGPH